MIIDLLPKWLWNNILVQNNSHSWQLDVHPIRKMAFDPSYHTSTMFGWSIRSLTNSSVVQNFKNCVFFQGC